MATRQWRDSNFAVGIRKHSKNGLGPLWIWALGGYYQRRSSLINPGWSTGAPRWGGGNTPRVTRNFLLSPSEKLDHQVPRKVFQEFPGGVLGTTVKPSDLGTVDAIAPTEL